MGMERRLDFAQKLLGGKLNNNYRNHILSEKQIGSKIASHFLNDSQTSTLLQNREEKVQTCSDGVKIVQSACFGCQSSCEVLVYVDEKTGKILKIEGNPESPITKGVLCAKGLASKNLVYNPARLAHPLKRIGKRGEGKWERISWEEALSTTAEKLLEYRKKLGPQGVAFLEGTMRGWSRVFSRLANVFGAVNHGATGWAQCRYPRIAADKSTFGAVYIDACDFFNTRCILLWGVNPPVNWAVSAADVMDARERGAPLIVVDPYLSEIASKADLWLQLKPGTDTALALSMLNVIINEGLFDNEFVKDWTVGFEELKVHVKRYTPQWGETITRVPQNLIVDAARMFAVTRPACIYRCVALDHLHDSVQACRAVSLLGALTGNIDIPGGNVLVSNRGERSQNSHEFVCAKMIDPELLLLRRGYDEFPFLCTDLSRVASAHMPMLWETIATEKPYPVKAALIFGANAMISYSNANRIKEALHNLDFLVVADLFMTPTAELADIVLPASSWLERDNVISAFQASTTYTIAQQKVVSFEEARSDVDIICALAEKLGLGHYFWKDARSLYEYILEPTKMTFDDFKKKGRLFAPLEYYQYKKKGFNTPSGKVELYSSVLEKHKCDPLPTYTDPFESSSETPERTREYPYFLTTGGRVSVFRHSENRENPLLREICPKPSFLIHPTTAYEHGIYEGEAFIIETPTGSATGYAVFTKGIHTDVIQATPGWWGRENINRVIPWGKYAQGVGTVPMRGILCRIKKIDARSKENNGEGTENHE